MTKNPKKEQNLYKDSTKPIRNVGGNTNPSAKQELSKDTNNQPHPNTPASGAGGRIKDFEYEPHAPVKIGGSGGSVGGWKNGPPSAPKQNLYKDSTGPSSEKNPGVMVGQDKSSWGPVNASNQSKAPTKAKKENLYKDSTNSTNSKEDDLIVGDDPSTWSPSLPSNENERPLPVGGDPRTWSPTTVNPNKNREKQQSHESWRRAAEEKEGPKLDAEIEAFTNKEVEVWEAGMAKSEDQNEMIGPKLKKKKHRHHNKNDHKKAA